jgi:outer membrane immunogenic protein
MKRILRTSAALAALVIVAGQALAADLPRRPAARAPMVAAPAPLFTWTGPYLGIYGGGGFADVDIGTPFGTSSHEISGAMVGGTIGYNWQSGGLVWGLEADVGYSGIDGGTSSFFCPGCSVRNSWLGTVRGRLGYALDSVMPYITGGLAVGDVETSVPGFPGHNETRAGWTAGGGLEVALTRNWSAKAEYLYVDLGSAACGAIDCGLPTTTDFRSHVLRAGVNFRF